MGAERQRKCSGVPCNALPLPTRRLYAHDQPYGMDVVPSHVFKGRVMTLQVNITANGRMSLPADIRKRLGLEDGGSVLIEETADGVMLRTVSQAVAMAQAIAKRYSNHPDASVDAFLAQRAGDSGQ